MSPGPFSPPNPPSRRKIFLMRGGILLLIVIVALVLYPECQVPERVMIATACLSNTKQNGFAFTIYATDFDDRLPPLGHWHKSISAYVRSDHILGCPGVPGEQSNGFGYAANESLAGAKLSEMANTGLEPLVFDSSVLTPGAWAWLDTLPNPYRHPHGNNIAFVDGHGKPTKMTGDPAKARN